MDEVTFIFRTPISEKQPFLYDKAPRVFEKSRESPTEFQTLGM